MFLVLLSFFEMYSGLIRYSKYLVFPWAFYIWLSLSPQFKFYFDRYTIVFLSFITISLFYIPYSGAISVKEPLLILSCLLPFIIFRRRYLVINVDRVFFWTVIAFLLANLPRITQIFFIGGLEDNFSFVFGMFVIYFVLKKDYSRAAIAFLLVLISLKRIALLGVCISSIMLFIPHFFRRYLLSSYFLVGLNVIGLFISCMFVLGSFDQLIWHYFDVHPAALSSGRYEIQKLAAQTLASDWQGFIYTGVGPSGALAFSAASFGQEVLMHNDVIKLCLEFGLLYFLLFFFLLYHKLNDHQKIFAIYLNITFYTDNTLIYAGVLFFYFSLSYTLNSKVSYQRENTAST